jgi:hypothetical protein
MLRCVFIAPMSNAVVKSIFDDVVNNTTSANYSVAAYSALNLLLLVPA